MAGPERRAWPPGAVHPPAISAHRLLGDGHSTALVRPDGEIDWWCAPAMDSPPLLWSLLDPGGAAARWVGVHYVRHGGRPAGPTTATVVRHRGRRVTCRDAVLNRGDGSLLVRLVRGDDDDLDIEHELAAGGFDQPWASWSGSGAQLASCTIAIAGSALTHVVGRHLRTRVHAPRGQWAAMVIGVNAEAHARVDHLVARLDQVEGEFQTNLGRARLPRHHPERAADALAVLSVCTYQPTGAVIASPTTSLPEAPGHGRQFDYRYSWLRDASLAVSVAALLGDGQATARFLDFIHGMASATRVPSGPMTDIRGGTVPDEREVPGVGGWGGSAPVRVGNAAKHQLQYDSLGLLLEGVSVYLQTGGSLDGATWSLVQAVADHLAGEESGGNDADGMRATNGIWELRQPRPLVSADFGRWLALDRAIWIARMRHPLRRRRRWKRAREAARRRVVAAIGDDGGLPQSYGETTRQADASSLMAALFGMVKGEQATRLVDATIGRLEAWPHLYRYEASVDDGLSGHEGTFVPMSWWAVASLAAVGQVEAARDRADALCAELPRLMAEEFDAEDQMSLGNVPLVWSHMAAARALYILDAAHLRRRYGAAGLTMWRIGRYLRLRASR